MTWKIIWSKVAVKNFYSFLIPTFCGKALLMLLSNPRKRILSSRLKYNGIMRKRRMSNKKGKVDEILTKLSFHVTELGEEDMHLSFPHTLYLLIRNSVSSKHARQIAYIFSCYDEKMLSFTVLFRETLVLLPSCLLISPILVNWPVSILGFKTTD